MKNSKLLQRLEKPIRAYLDTPRVQQNFVEALRKFQYAFNVAGAQNQLEVDRDLTKWIERDDDVQRKKIDVYFYILPNTQTSTATEFCSFIFNL